MPYKSDAQRKFFNSEAGKEKIGAKEVEKWNKESKGLNLPEKVTDMVENKTYKIQGNVVKAAHSIAQMLGYDKLDIIEISKQDPNMIAIRNSGRLNGTSYQLKNKGKLVAIVFELKTSRECLVRVINSKSKDEFTCDSTKYTGRTWNEFIKNIEANSGYKVDSAFKRNSDEYINLLKGEKSYKAEVTKYQDGTFELMDYNIKAKDALTSYNIITFENIPNKRKWEKKWKDKVYFDGHDLVDAETGNTIKIGALGKAGTQEEFLDKMVKEYFDKQTKDAKTNDATRAEIIEKLRNNSIPEGKKLEIGDKNGWMAQIQNHGMTEMRFKSTGSKKVSSKQVSAVWGRIWYEGKLIEQFEGPLFVVKSDMIKFLNNQTKDATWQFTGSDNSGKRHSFSVKAPDKQEAIKKSMEKAKKQAKGDLSPHWDVKLVSADTKDELFTKITTEAGFTFGYIDSTKQYIIVNPRGKVIAKSHNPDPIADEFKSKTGRRFIGMGFDSIMNLGDKFKNERGSVLEITNKNSNGEISYKLNGRELFASNAGLSRFIEKNGYKRTKDSEVKDMEAKEYSFSVKKGADLKKIKVSANCYEEALTKVKEEAKKLKFKGKKVKSKFDGNKLDTRDF